MKNRCPARLAAPGTLTISALLALAALSACSRGSTPEPAVNNAVPSAAAERTASRTPDVVFVPTPFPVMDRMLEVARVRRGDVLYDLGSGDGRIVIAAARKFGVRGIGIDIDPVRVAESKSNADTAKVADLVEFREADLFTTDLRSATVVTLYLLPELNVRLRPKLFKELEPDSRVVSHSFDMGDWKADSTLSVDSRAVYYWVIPADVAGAWTVKASIAGSERDYRVRLAQEYQRITSAEVQTPSGMQVSDARVSGDSISFTISGAGGSFAFAGRVNANEMNGTVTGGGRSGKWRATRAP